MNKKKIIWAVVAIVAVLAIGSWFFGGSPEAQKVHVATAPVIRGNVSESITATGTIEPVTEVEVGAQVTGIIDRIYVDYNSVVKKGQLIAEIDKVTLMSDLRSSQANYNGSKASYEYQEKLYNRNKQLHDKQLISDQEYDQSLYNYQNAKAQFEQSTANLAKAQRNLSYATIYSPIDGVVINKAVEEGQTVTSGFNTPTLFNIAADLTQMRVIADVDEADIGGIEEGQRATFTVDAYPDETFEGTVVQVRLGESDSASSSVVTYEVVINAPNLDLKLKPRLTANVTIYKQEHNDVILVPSRALRFRPTPAIGATQINDVDAPQKVWTKEGNVYTAHAVTVGMTGNSMTEIVSGISEGMEVVTDATSTVRENSMMDRMPGMGGGAPGGGAPGGGGPGGGGPGGPM